MPQVNWKRGEFHKFYAKMKIRVGGKDTIDIQKGDEFEFDGTLVKYAGAEFSQLAVRGAIARDWATFTQDEYVPDTFMPPRDVALSQTKNTDLAHVQRTKAVRLDTTVLDEETVLKVSDRRPEAQNNLNAPPQKLTSDDNRRRTSITVKASEFDDQEAVLVGRVRSSPKLEVPDITKQANLASTIENRGLGRPQLFKPNRSPIEREGVTIKTNVGDVSSTIHIDDEQEKVVAKIRPQSSTKTEGIEIKDTSIRTHNNIRSENGSPTSKSTKSYEDKGHPSKVIKPVLPKIDKSKLSQKHQIAILLFPSFPIDWNFMAPVPERIEKAKTFANTIEESEQFLKALYAAEGNSMRTLLQKQYPAVFK